MEETLEGGRGPPRAVEPLEREREDNVLILYRKSFRFGRETWLIFILFWLKMTNFGDFREDRVFIIHLRGEILHIFYMLQS